jgi:hypothetical protein
MIKLYNLYIYDFDFINMENKKIYKVYNIK